MKRFFIAAILVLVSFYAVASCPAWAPYRCYMLPTGKQICGCGV